MRRIAVAALVALVAPIVIAAAPVAARPKPPPVDRTAPTQPTGLRVTAVTQTSVTLSWEAATDNVGVRSYSLWGEGVSGVVSVAHPQTTATWSSLRPGQTVTFRVTAFDAQYNASPPSPAVTVTTVADTTPPTTPTGVTVSHVTASTVLLTWSSGTDAFGPVRHEVLVDGAPTSNAWSTVPAGTFPRPASQSAWVRQLEPSTGYRFSVRAIDPSGNTSAPSDAVGATTLPSTDAVAPTSPTLLSAASGGNGSCPEELWLRWTAASDDREPPSGIEYEVRVNGLINEVVPGGTQTITYTEVLGANTVTIVAVDRAGNASAPSNAQTVTTNWAPGGCGS
jgi:chitodextrinase